MDFKVGQLLKAQREHKGLSCEQIYEITKISVDTLQNIEAGENLPAPIFLKNFVRLYARALEMDEETVLRELKKFNASSYEGKAPKRTQNKSRLFLIFRKKVIFCAGLIVIGFFLNQKYLKNKDIKSNQTSSAENLAKDSSSKNNPLKEFKEIKALKEPESSFLDTVRQSEQSFKQEVLVQALEGGVMYIKIDGSELQTQVLEPKKWHVVKAFEKIYIRIQKETFINIIHNGYWKIKNKKQIFEHIFE